MGKVTGRKLIVAERQRQVEEEGWTNRHDDKHVEGQLADAADCYAMYGHSEDVPAKWPWEMRWWKPSADPVRCCVKAGALYQAEIDRLTRSRNGLMPRTQNRIRELNKSIDVVVADLDVLLEAKRIKEKRVELEG